jgi:hypothetical protein
MVFEIEPYYLSLARFARWTSLKDNTAALRQVAKEHTRVLQVQAIEDAIAEAANPATEDDRAPLLSLCDMSHRASDIH